MSFPFIAYYKRFPDFPETMSIEVQPGSPILFPGVFHFIEHYCSNPACDCRRVRIVVVEGGDLSKPLSTMDWGFEMSDYYQQWTADEKSAEWLVAGFLDPDSPQSEYSGTCLDFLRHLVTTGDNSWDAGIRDRYFKFKASLGEPATGGPPAAPCLQGARFRGETVNEE